MQFQRYYGFSLKYDIVMGDNMGRQMIEFFTAWGFSVFSWAVVFCILAGVFSPCKWLVLLCLSDISVTVLPFFLLREYIRNKKDKRYEDWIKMAAAVFSCGSHFLL